MNTLEIFFDYYVSIQLFAYMIHRIRAVCQFVKETNGNEDINLLFDFILISSKASLAVVMFVISLLRLY